MHHVIHLRIFYCCIWKYLILRRGKPMRALAINLIGIYSTQLWLSPIHSQSPSVIYWLCLAEHWKVHYEFPYSQDVGPLGSNKGAAGWNYLALEWQTGAVMIFKMILHLFKEMSDCCFLTLASWGSTAYRFYTKP